MSPPPSSALGAATASPAAPHDTCRWRDLPSRSGEAPRGRPRVVATEPAAETETRSGRAGRRGRLGLRLTSCRAGHGRRAAALCIILQGKDTPLAEPPHGGAAGLGSWWRGRGGGGQHGHWGAPASPGDDGMGDMSSRRKTKTGRTGRLPCRLPLSSPLTSTSISSAAIRDVREGRGRGRSRSRSLAGKRVDRDAYAGNPFDNPFEP